MTKLYQKRKHDQKLPVSYALPSKIAFPASPLIVILLAVSARYYTHSRHNSFCINELLRRSHAPKSHAPHEDHGDSLEKLIEYL